MTFNPSLIIQALAQSLWKPAMFLGVVALIIIATRYFVVPPSEYDFIEQASVYAENQAALLLHAGFGALALSIGFLQLFPFLRQNFISIHRMAGDLYAGAVLLSAIGAFHLAEFAYGGISNAVAFYIFCCLWVLATVLGVYHTFQCNIDAHRRWMLRSYALCFAAVSLRAEVFMLTAFGQLPFDQAYAIASWTCWTGNLLFTEWVLLNNRSVGLNTMAPTRSARSAL